MIPAGNQGFQPVWAAIPRRWAGWTGSPRGRGCWSAARARRRRWDADPGHGAAARAPLGGARTARVPGYQANSGSGGARAGAIGGGELGSSRWSRILFTTSPSVIVAINLRAPPQWGQVRTSTANMRRKSSAQVDLRVLAAVLCAAGEAWEHASPPLSWGGSARARGPGTIWSRHCAAGASTPW